MQALHLVCFQAVICSLPYVRLLWLGRGEKTAPFLGLFSGFMLNLCSVALQLCDSFLLSKGKGKYKQIEPHYCTSRGCRLRFDNERMLAGGHIGE